MSISSKPKVPRFAASGVTFVAYDDSGSMIICAGSDGVVRVFKGYDDLEPAEMDHHQEGVTGLACRGSRIFTCSLDRTVAAFNLDYPNITFDCNISRCSLPVCDIALNGTGSSIALCSEEISIKLVNTLDPSQCQMLTGLKKNAVSLSYDPKSQYIASSGSDGAVDIWDINEKSCVKRLEGILSISLANGGMPGGRLHWSPDNGKYLAIPSGNNCAIVERDSWKTLFSLQSDEGHEKPVLIARWSPSGNFLATASADGNIIIWDVSSKEIIRSFRYDKGIPIADIAWHPKGNSIAWTDNQGMFSVWEDLIPSSIHGKPTKPLTLENSNESDRADLEAFDDDDRGPEVMPKKRKLLKKRACVESDGEEELDYGHDDIEEEVREKITRSRRNQSPEYGDNDFGDIMDEDNFDSYEKEQKEQKAVSSKHHVEQPQKVKIDLASLIIEPQESFQSTASPMGLKRRFLAWNTVGVIISRDENTYNLVDIEFHDTSSNRNIHMTDHYGFSMGTLNSSGALLASVGSNGNLSTLTYRHFDPWAQNSDWSLCMNEDEDITNVALGNLWAAVATDRYFLRLFTISGIQFSILALPGPVVSMAGMDDLLLIAYRMGGATFKVDPDEDDLQDSSDVKKTNGDQNLKYIMLDVSKKKTLCDGNLCLSPFSELMWLGFSDSGVPATYDSAGVIRILSKEWDFMWQVLFDTGSIKRNMELDHIWLVGLTEKEIIYIMCHGDPYPQTLPRPTLSVHPIVMPLCNVHTDTGKFEELYIRSNLQYSHAMDSAENISPHALAKLKAAADTNLLQLIQIACKTDKPLRALDLTSLLKLDKSINIAMKLALKKNLPSLAERMDLVLKAKQMEERKSTETITPMRTHATPTQGMGNEFVHTPFTAKPITRVQKMSVPAPQTPVPMAKPEPAPVRAPPAPEEVKKAPEMVEEKVDQTENGHMNAPYDVGMEEGGLSNDVADEYPPIGDDANASYVSDGNGSRPGSRGANSIDNSMELFDKRKDEKQKTMETKVVRPKPQKSNPFARDSSKKKESDFHLSSNIFENISKVAKKEEKAPEKLKPSSAPKSTSGTTSKRKASAPLQTSNMKSFFSSVPDPKSTIVSKPDKETSVVDGDVNSNTEQPLSSKKAKVDEGEECSKENVAAVGNTLPTSSITKTDSNDSLPPQAEKKAASSKLEAFAFKPST